MDAWTLSRKNFIRTVLAGGIIAQFPITGFSAKAGLAEKDFLNDAQRMTLTMVQNILFPADGNGPGAKDVNALDYLEWVIADPEKDPDEVKYILNGIGWLNETCAEMFSKDFDELTMEKQEKIIAVVSRERWGENWLSVILTFIFEALLCDPQYPGNTDSVGWEWLNYIPGQPEPSAELLYPEILTTIRKQAD